MTVTGLEAKLNLTHTEPLDKLDIQTDDGDTVDSSGLEPG